MFPRYISAKYTGKLKFNISVCYNFMSDYVEFSAPVLYLGLGTKKHLVRAGTSSWFSVKGLFWSPRSRMEMARLLWKTASFYCHKKGWKHPHGSLEIPAGVTQTMVGSLAAVLVIMILPLSPSPADVLKMMIYHTWYKSRPLWFAETLNPGSNLYSYLF